MFDRWNCAWERTWAFRLFRKHHTELNAVYWAHTAASNNSLKAVKSHPVDTLASQVFPVPQADKGRLNRTLEQWQTEYKEFNNWVNLSAAVSLASYVEIYFLSVVTLSLESDPAILLGAPKAVDGAKLLKNQKDYSYTEHSIPVVKGTWQERAQAYKQYFGSIPEIFENSISELDQLRILRNGIGHTFGRPVDIYKTEKISIDPQPLQRLSRDRLKKWLGIAEAVVLDVDNHLRNTHLGSYEVIRYFHKWLKDTKHNTFDHVPFKKHLNSLIGNTPGKDFFKGLSRYYSKL
jgi:hypothetical protein